MPKDPKITSEKYARLKAEAIAPYRGLRKFIYVACAASAGIGAMIFFLQILAGREVTTAVPNLAVQVGVLALMLWLFQIDQAKEKINKKNQ
jgi:high-affinity Fe2+/Pb2+ permease